MMRERLLLLLLLPVGALALFAANQARVSPTPPAPAAVDQGPGPPARADLPAPGALDAGPASHAGSGAQEPDPKGANESIFAEWVALGSGCRGQSDGTGNVTAERFIEQEGGKTVYGMRYHLDQYRLTSEGRGPDAPANFARECNIRLQIGPPPGKRIARVLGRTQVVSSKSEGTKLTLLGELIVGGAVVGREVVVLEAGATHGDEVRVFDLVSGAKPEETLPALECAEKTLFGFSYTWLAERQQTSDGVQVTLSGDRILELRAELADCE